jgi:hypothetical protein
MESRYQIDPFMHYIRSKLLLDDLTVHGLVGLDGSVTDLIKKSQVINKDLWF